MIGCDRLHPEKEGKMALREIRVQGDPILNKVCKPVAAVSDRILELIDDMLDTMYDANGVGLAASQVGILKRIVVIDCSAEQDEAIVLINPEMLETRGEQFGLEGCLSVPGKSGEVRRPAYAKVKAYNEDMEEFIIEGEDLLARALCHEIDHLNGVLFTDLADEMVDPKDLEDKKDNEK